MRATHALALGLVAAAAATPLDDFVNRPEPDYAWFDMQQPITNLPSGGTATLLNVTSLRWMDESRAQGPNGAVWSHHVAVVVPAKVTVRNVSVAVMTGNCNKDKPPAADEEYLVLADTISATTGAVAIVIYQIPNCPITYPSDPELRGRSEDAMIAWAWRQYLDDPTHDPEWLPRLPMVKAGFQCMRAAQEYLAQNHIAEVEGWIASGASKRGWTTWGVGMAECSAPECVHIAAIVPLVPIVPDITKEAHRQWRSYGGFTFAFKDYTDANVTVALDSEDWLSAAKIMDPVHYKDRLARLPKLVVLSSDDEFMQFDWSGIWLREELAGEKHLLIGQNSEHSLATAIPEIVQTVSALTHAVAYQKPRPRFDYEYDAATGAVTVTIPQDVAHGKVVLRHAQTLSTTRRDFRWVRLASDSDPCTLPEIPLEVSGGNCIAPIVWLGTTLDEVDGRPGVFRGVPPEPAAGHWTGYYIEIYFPHEVGTFMLTTEGYVWPDTLPFPDCHAETCGARLV